MKKIYTQLSIYLWKTSRKAARVAEGALHEANRVVDTLATAAARSARASYSEIYLYLESDLFEFHLDEFADGIGLDFYSIGMHSRFLKSKMRKIRIVAKCKIIGEVCGRELAIDAAAGGAIGVKLLPCPHAASIGVLIGSSLRVGYYGVVLSRALKLGASLLPASNISFNDQPS